MSQPLTRCPHTDPERGRCIMTPHETFTESTHSYLGSPEHLASPLAPLLTHFDAGRADAEG